MRILLCYSTDLPEAQGVRVTKDGSDDSSWNNEDGSADSTGESEWFTWIIRPFGIVIVENELISMIRAELRSGVMR